MRKWQLQEAKACLSELIKQAKNTGPQKITVRGEPTAVVISIKEYEKLLEPKTDLVSFIRRSPLSAMDLDFERDQSLTRDVDL